jgi:hypothetical protein
MEWEGFLLGDGGKCVLYDDSEIECQCGVPMENVGCHGRVKIVVQMSGK